MNKYLIPAAFLVIAISGCSHTPREVEAKVALVEAENIQYQEAIPRKYWASLDHPSTTQVNASGMLIQIGSPYTSGLGQECRELQMTTELNENRTRIACAKIVTTDSNSTKTEKAWFLTDDIVESSTIIKIQ